MSYAEPRRSGDRRSDAHPVLGRRVNLSAGRFLVPLRYKGNPYSSARLIRLFERVAERLGAPLVYSDDVTSADLPADCPFVMALNPVRWCYSDGFRGLLSLPPRIRVFGLWDDIHQGKQGTRYFHRDRRILVRFFRRCDAILCTNRAPFERWYRRYTAKLVHFPFFFAEDDFAPISFNPSPLPKCILSGAISAYYPFRLAAARNPDVVLMPHPGYGDAADAGASAYFGSAYARELARYHCGVTCSSILDYVVAKYMELPAAGCLLLATHASDLEALGYRNGVNFLQVDEDTFDDTLAEVLARPEAFEGIRRAGFELVRSRHSERNRVDELERFIRERCAVPVRG